MNVKKPLVFVPLLIAMAVPSLGNAQSTAEQSNVSAAEAKTLTTGEVKRLDLDAGKVTIKHGEIKNLQMPPMTMVFVAKDRNQLANLKVGDKVTFVVLNEAGKFIASDIQPDK